MGKVIFTVKYDIYPEKRDEYLNIVKEMKNLVKAEGLESYCVYQLRNKPEKFEEVYVFENEQAYDDFDDKPDERLELLMGKLTNLIKEQTTEYSTLLEIHGN
ncbi:MAG: antibiotic biosynthesis monooxygenase [Ignavibacteriales bacterium]|nr:antibiotic biosynthesis monooxygenase [Ignavibacteriales bacterium]MCF8305397.1 antibiotic biosynthesis monooxygenase [Ignavibacteriales bacterium]MCF8316080.1 antibiotic biosynthesis monooxygenase [Ignavibacteriales bacterium]MCF8436582.1 antibiotic biosynthesis monooxygenase [Ignavibacteriales bacterium]